MKIGNNGWGMKEMIIFMAILLSFLLLAAYNVSRLYRAMDNSKTDVTYVNNNTGSNEEPVEDKTEEIPKLDEDYYEKLEEKFKNSTLDYLNTYHYDLSSQIMKVSYDTLNGLNFLEMTDQFGNKTCDGYSNVFYDNTNEEYVVKPYIRCVNYTSVGY